MKVKFAQKYLQSLIVKFFALSALLTILYHLFFFVVNTVNPANYSYNNWIVVIISVIGFYLSVVPIKIMSLLFPNLYNFTSITNFPQSKDIWAFLLEQSVVVIFVTISFFAIYVLLMWIKRIYDRLSKKEVEKKKWSKFSITIGFMCLLYYLMVLLVASSMLGKGS